MRQSLDHTMNSNTSQKKATTRRQPPNSNSNVLMGNSSSHQKQNRKQNQKKSANELNKQPKAELKQVHSVQSSRAVERPTLASAVPLMDFHKHNVTTDYRISKTVLGVGINGKVVECEQRSTGAKYALKVLRDTEKVRLHKMASHHPHIVRILDVYENSYNDVKCLLVVMEQMKGGELFNRIQEKGATGFTEREAAKITYEICSAVNYLHSMNIAHRDIKPENILYSEPGASGVLKLTDFGFAKRTDENEPQGLHTACFTPYYCAPEILSAGKYDKSCDCWSIGVVMYILLCGYPPFFSEHGEAMSPGMKNRIKSGRYTFPSPEWDSVSQAAKDLIKKLLKTDPSDRYSIQQVMEHKWITHYHEVPPTPLATVGVLADQRGQWGDLQEEIDKTLTTMRMDAEQIEIKSLADSNNRLLAKRKQKQTHMETTVEEDAAAMADA